MIMPYPKDIYYNLLTLSLADSALDEGFLEIIITTNDMYSIWCEDNSKFNVSLNSGSLDAITVWVFFFRTTFPLELTWMILTNGSENIEKFREINFTKKI